MNKKKKAVQNLYNNSQHMTFVLNITFNFSNWISDDSVLALGKTKFIIWRFTSKKITINSYCYCINGIYNNKFSP